MDPQLKAQLQQTILVSNSTSVNSYGEAVYGASTSAPARVVGKKTVSLDERGQTIISTKQIITPSSVDVRIDSLIYLPGESSSANSGWTPVSLALRIGEAGSSDHWKVWL